MASKVKINRNARIRNEVAARVGCIPLANINLVSILYQIRPVHKVPYLILANSGEKVRYFTHNAFL